MQRPMIATISRSVHCSVLAAVVLLLAAPGTLPAQSGSVIVEHSRVYVFVAKKGAGHDHGVEGLLAAGDLHFGSGQARVGGEYPHQGLGFGAIPGGEDFDGWERAIL